MPKNDEKNRLRMIMKEKRGLLGREEQRQAALHCFTKLKQLPDFCSVHWIYVYMSCRKEVDTSFMIDDFLSMGKKVAVPKVQRQEMDFYEIHSLNDCVSGAYGIMEPVSAGNPVMEKGWMLVPGLAFDTAGNRLGYGGGFYDRYLEKHPDLVTIALAYDFQMTEVVPSELHDRKMDYVVTPKHIFVKKS